MLADGGSSLADKRYLSKARQQRRLLTVIIFLADALPVAPPRVETINYTSATPTDFDIFLQFLDSRSPFGGQEGSENDPEP